jgi:hypothetical protein
MAYINVSPANSNVTIQISTASISTTSSGYIIPALQDVAINNGTAVFNWTQLDSFAQQAVPTPANNSIAANLVIDPTTFFTGSNGVAGIFDLSNNATLVYFRTYLNGRGTGAKYVSGQGYITGLAPTANPTAPVFVSPITISVDGVLTASTV